MRMRVLGGAVLALAACSTENNLQKGASATPDARTAADTGAVGTVCEPGRSEGCACPDGRSGAQTCADDGARWLSCVCAGGGGGGGAVADGGAGGATADGGAGGERPQDAFQAAGGKPVGTFDGGEGTPDAGAQPPSDEPVGSFILRLVAPIAAQNGAPAVAGVTTLVGRVNDGPTPVLVEWLPTDATPTCALLEPNIPFCDPPCGGGAACVHENVCQAYPRAHTVGTVHLDGVRTNAGGTAYDVEPLNNTYQYTDSPFPGFDEGAALRLDAAGGDYAPFSIDALGVAPLVVPEGAIELARGAGLSLSWGAPGIEGISTVHVRVDISHHGGARGAIECDVPDNGHLLIPAALTDGLLDLGVAGFPVVQISRRHVGSAQLAVGRVDLSVLSEVERPLDIPGLVSCTDDSACPPGAFCREDLSCSDAGEVPDAAVPGGDAAAPPPADAGVLPPEPDAGPLPCVPSPELCNGVDDDCDGEIDEALVRACEADNAAGVCAGVETCVDGGFVGCDAPVPADEACDGLDNNCDGQIDEAVFRVCSVSNGLGTCSGTERCGAGAWGGCDARTPAAETCNGTDDDCDGQTDEALSRPCQQVNGFGTCTGVETCGGGAWGGCTAAVPVAEICDDGADNNCNGQVDENCGCSPGTTTPCYTGSAATRRVGVCADGLATCGANRQFGECVGQVLPGIETCNGRDDDCDGSVDELLSQACQMTNAQGTCGGTETCMAGAWVGCNAAVPAAELCDGLDNNCSGAADENLSRACQVVNGFGTCRGVEACQGAAWAGCTAAVPAAEMCDNVDNNCNGQTDENLSRACQVANGFGTCTGVETCGAGAWRGCTAATPAAEACDGRDNNCNGQIDEGCLPHFSFFVTSWASLQQLSGSANGFGGDLRYGEVGAGAGLRGADRICATIADLSMPGASAKGWKAFLSAANDGAGNVVNAVDRVGMGPWYDRLGRTFALTKADLLFDRPRNCDAAICNDFPNEWGVLNHQPDPLLPQVDNHDMLTGSNIQGGLYGATFTCLDWTSSSRDTLVTGRPRVGHSWPRPCNGGPDRMCNWMSSLNEAGCGAGANLIEMGPPNLANPTVGSGGGYGGFYCFALQP